MNEVTILPVRPDTISSDDKLILKAAGVIVIECANPDEIRLIKPCAEMSSSDMLMAAMRAIKNGGDYNTKISFSNLMLATLEDAKK